jgi:hypothetical protein
MRLLSVKWTAIVMNDQMKKLLLAALVIIAGSCGKKN